jgi:hypothetical protein
MEIVNKLEDRAANEFRGKSSSEVRQLSISLSPLLRTIIDETFVSLELPFRVSSYGNSENISFSNRNGSFYINMRNSSTGECESFRLSTIVHSSILKRDSKFMSVNYDNATQERSQQIQQGN